MVSILHLEDNPFDGELVQEALGEANLDCQITRVQTRREFEAEVRKGGYDVILADYRLPGYDGTSALRLTREVSPDIPFIFVSGTMGEDAAIEGLTQGATDYVLKQKLSRLAPAVRRALKDAENHRERKRAEIALQESAERFRAVAESANEAIISVNSQGAIVYWNKAASTIFGYSLEEVSGEPIFILMPGGYQKQLGNRDLWNSNSILLQVGKVLESFGRRKDGSEFPIEVSIGSWDTKEGRFFTGMVRDVSERKQAEENLRLQGAALEAAANGIIITDREGTITWVNPALTRLTGYTAQELIGQNPRIFKSGVHGQPFYRDLWDTILSGKIWHNEQVNRHKDGHFYVEEMTIAPVQQQKGEISHFIAIKQDVSERKRHELEREAIISVAEAIRSTTKRSELEAIFLKQIEDLFNTEGAVISIFNPMQSEIIIEAGYGRIGEQITGLHLPVSAEICHQVMVGGERYVNNTAYTDLVFFQPGFLAGPHAVAGVPLIAQDQVIGALWMFREKEISESELNLLTAIANLAANAIHRVTLHEQTEQQLHQMAALHQIDTAINADFDLKNVLNVLLNNVLVQLEVDAADVLLLMPDTQTLEYAAGIGFRTDNIEKSRVLLGEGRAGAAAAERRIISFPYLDQAQDTFSRTVLLSGEAFVSHITVPLIAKGELKGVLEVFKRERLDPPPEWYDFFKALATQAAIAIGNANLFKDLQHSNKELAQAYHATIEGWAHALDLRDKETEGHTRRVTEMTLRLARAMSVEESDLVNMRRGAILHDIGKMGIPDDILFKPGSLTAEEWVTMRKHPVYAFQMLSSINYLKPAMDIPYCHHEKWDGSGYPRGLKGEEIPLAARIFAIIDVWDALRSNRRYRQAWKEPEILDYIREQAGKHFDPSVVEAFLKAKPWMEPESNA